MNFKIVALAPKFSAENKLVLPLTTTKTLAEFFPVGTPLHCEALLDLFGTLKSPKKHLTTYQVYQVRKANDALEKGLEIGTPASIFSAFEAAKTLEFLAVHQTNSLQVLDKISKMCLSLLSEFIFHHIEKDIPSNRQEQQPYFEAYLLHSYLVQSLEMQSSIVHSLSTENICLTMLKQKHFKFTSVIQKTASNDQVASYIRKRAKALGQCKTTFEVNYTELIAYLDFLATVLNTYHNPSLEHSRDELTPILDAFLEKRESQDRGDSTASFSPEGYYHLFFTTQSLKATQWQKQQEIRNKQKAIHREKKMAAYAEWRRSYATQLERTSSELSTIAEKVYEFLKSRDSDPADKNLGIIKKLLKEVKAITSLKGEALLSRQKEALKSKLYELREDELRIVQAFEAQNTLCRTLGKEFSKEFLDRPKFIPSDYVHTADFLSILNALYRNTALIGDGGTATITYLEAEYSVRTSNFSHIFKTIDALNKLHNIDPEALSLSERKILEYVISDLEKAQKHFYFRLGITTDSELGTAVERLEYMSPSILLHYSKPKQ